jgi:hypothetical protein
MSPLVCHIPLQIGIKFIGSPPCGIQIPAALRRSSGRVKYASSQSKQRDLLVRRDQHFVKNQHTVFCVGNRNYGSFTCYLSVYIIKNMVLLSAFYLCG